MGSNKRKKRESSRTGYRTLVLGVVLGCILNRSLDNLLFAFRVAKVLTRIVMDTDITTLATTSYEFEAITPINKNTNTNTSTAVATPNNPGTGTGTKEKLHVLFGMMGTTPSLYDAWEVALKSILVNAPIDADMEVHVLCDNDACGFVQQKIEDTDLEGSQWRNQITIRLYNVEARSNDWRAFLRKKTRREGIDERVSLGGYYRLLAYELLAPLDIGPALYMDTDAIVIANLNELMRTMDDSKVFQGSSGWFCSGFVVINMKKFHEFWDLVDRLKRVPPLGDQYLMNAVLKAFPKSYGALPIEWARNMGNGYRKMPHKILDEGAAGMLHYQGGWGRVDGENYFTHGFEQYCDRVKECSLNKDNQRRKVAQTWGLGDYYTRLPWKWAIYFGKSAIASGTDGFALKVTTFVAGNHTAEVLQ